MTSLLSAETETQLKAFLQSGEVGNIPQDISDLLTRVDPLQVEDLQSLELPILGERLLLLSETALRLGQMEISDRLLTLVETAGDSRKFRAKRDLIDLVRHGKFWPEISDPKLSVQEVVRATKETRMEIAALIKVSVITHRLKKLANSHRSLKISDCIQKIGVHTVEEISEAALWSQRTVGVPAVSTEISGDWLRLHLVCP